MTNELLKVGTPERPRLRSGCTVFEDKAGPILRSSRGAYRVAPEHRAATCRALQKLDGRHDVAAVLEGERVEDAFYLLRLLDALGNDGLLAEGNCTGLPALPLAPREYLDGLNLNFPVQGRIAAELGERLKALGANVLIDGNPGEAPPNAILVVAPDGADLALLENTNRRAYEAGTAWLPVFPFGDAIVVGPRVHPGVTPCFRCFQLRWLGISPSISLELIYFEHLRQAGSLPDAVKTREEAARFASLVLPAVAKCLTSRQQDAEVTLLRPDDGAVSVATLEPHPGCDVCAPRITGAHQGEALPRRIDWFEPPVSLAEIGERLRAQARSFCGLSSLVASPSNGTGSMPSGLPNVALARFALPEPEDLTGDQSNWSHGSAACPEDAQTLAIIEAIERYNGLSQPSHVLWESYASVAARAILPTELPLFSSAQYAQPGFPFQPFHPGRVTRWCEGYNLTRRKSVLVPATAAWYGLDDELLGETSSGVAAHSARGHALLNGVLELVERDAFMIHWLHRLSPPLVTPEHLEGTRCSELMSHIAQSGYSVRLADLTTDLGIPVFLGIGFRDDRRRPALVVGAGASLDPIAAATRALTELCSATQQDNPFWTLKPPMAPQDIRQLEDHCRAYQHPDWLPRASFLWASSRTTSLRPREVPGNPLDGLSLLIDLLARHGHDLLGVDITGTDVAKLGLRVVRAIVPGLQPLGFGSRVRLGGRRLYEAPVRMGYHESPVREEDLNTVPHCFP